MLVENLVNHPRHYNIKGRKECIDELLEKYGAEYTYIWCLMTIDKYEYRKGKKQHNSLQQEEAKIKWYKNKAEQLRKDYNLDIEL